MKREKLSIPQIQLDELVKVKGYFENRFPTLGIVTGIEEEEKIYYILVPVEKPKGISYWVLPENIIHIGELDENTGKIKKLFYPKDYIKPQSKLSKLFNILKWR